MRMRSVISRCTRGTVAQALRWRHPPDVGQSGQPCSGMALDQDAQVVALVEDVEVKRRDLPASLGDDLQKALARQALQGLAQRRAADGQTPGPLAFAAAVTRHQRKVEDQMLELGVGLIGQGDGLGSLGGGWGGRLGN